MTTWTDNIHAKAALVHDQIMAFKEAQRLHGVDTSGAQQNYWKLLEKLYTENLPLARLMDTSDILLHAEGPAAADASPSLHAVNWLCQTAEKQLSNLAKAAFELSAEKAAKLASKIDLRMTGFAPGSIYAGFKLQEPPPSELFDTEPLFANIRDAITRLPEIPGFVGDEAIHEAIYEALPDSAIRDAMLTAALHLSPTGRIGIHTLELSSPVTHHPTAELSQRERVVIREALKHPKLSTPKQGVFQGEIRELDLDARRFHLRGVKDIGTLRCILPDHYNDGDSKAILGDYVEVSGQYETNKNGMPRLMVVTNIRPALTPRQQDLFI